MKFLAIATACFLAMAAAKGAERLPRYGNDCAYCVLLELDRLAALLGDPVLKNLVCQLAFESYTPGALSSALHISPEQVMRRIDTLSGWGLVRTVSRNSAPMIVEPYPGYGADTLRRWALRYCPLGDVCGEPGPDGDIPRDTGLSNAAKLNGGEYPLKISDESDDSRKLAEAIARIDAVNSVDPQKISRDGQEQARELLASKRRSFWVDKLSPRADSLIHIAARAQHIARWEIPRSKYPQGRVGYHEWRNALAKFHGEKTAEILADLGYSSEQVDRVKVLIEKKNFAEDPDTQLLEDVASLVFFEYDFDKFATTQPEEKLLGIIQRTWRKMSAKGRRSVRGLKLSTASMKLVNTALKDVGDVKY